MRSLRIEIYSVFGNRSDHLRTHLLESRKGHRSQIGATAFRMIGYAKTLEFMEFSANRDSKTTWAVTAFGALSWCALAAVHKAYS